jgi:hypothetical protein
MIAPADIRAPQQTDAPAELQPDGIVVARYGRVPQVARFACRGFVPERTASVVARTDRGEELVTVLQRIPFAAAAPTAPSDGPPHRRETESEPAAAPAAADQQVLWTGDLIRLATPQDLQAARDCAASAEAAFPQWLERVTGWKLQLELIDIEHTLDGRLILYVLNDRGAETTRLALLSAAGGFGIVHVQPVGAEGIIESTAGGCGSGGCGSGGCATH